MDAEQSGGAGPALRQFAVNLFYGYGYNFYREENQLRADDQRIRRMVSELLQRGRKLLSEAESHYRRDRLPPPTRAQPFPPAEAQAGARRLEGVARMVSDLDARIAHLPVPGNDFMTQRFRKEAELLRQLSEKDVELVTAAQALYQRVAGMGYEEILKIADLVEGDISTVQGKLLERQTLLV